MNIQQLKCYTEAQNIARRTMEDLEQYVAPGMTEDQIKRQAEILLIQNGSTSFWYHGVGALVHVGERTLISQGGREYRSGDTRVQGTDVITVDLAPTLGTCWGDFARTIFVEDGRVVRELSELQTPAYKAAIEAEFKLHSFLLEVARPEMTFEELYFSANALIDGLGCKNLDYSGNLGHSINVLQQDRIYIEKGNTTPLKDAECECFTFEPHICKQGGAFGVKRENIYYFVDGRLKEM